MVLMDSVLLSYTKPRKPKNDTENQGKDGTHSHPPIHDTLQYVPEDAWSFGGTTAAKMQPALKQLHTGWVDIKHSHKYMYVRPFATAVKRETEARGFYFILLLVTGSACFGRRTHYLPCPDGSGNESRSGQRGGDMP